MTAKDTSNYLDDLGHFLFGFRAIGNHMLGVVKKKSGQMNIQVPKIYYRRNYIFVVAFNHFEARTCFNHLEPVL